MKILLVDDNEELRTVLMEVLACREHVVEEVASAEDAITKLPGDYQLIISDVQLDRLNGVALLEEVNRMTPRVPVVMITGNGDEDVENLCREKGAAGFLHKPFSVHELLGLIDSLAEGSTS